MTLFRSKLILAILTVASVAGPVQAQSLAQNLPNPYKDIESWGKLPEGKSWGGSIYAPGIDSHGNLWVLTRCGVTNCAETNDPAVLEFDPTGKFVKGIGQGVFAFPHGLYIDKEDNLWVADSGTSKGKGNQVTKLSPDGKVLLSLGKAGVLGGSPENFIGASAVLVAPNGDIFVADGHAVPATGGGRSLGYSERTADPTHMRIAKFSKDGKFIKAWGKLGTGPGEFNVPHGIAMDSKGRLFIADRGNSRIQIFDQDGKFLDQWKQFGKPVGVYIDNKDTLFAIDSDSNANLSNVKYSTVRRPCADCIARVPRLTDVGTDNPDFMQGIRIGSATDGVVRAFIPAHYGPNGPTNLPEFMVSDAKGDLYVAESRNETLRKYIKKVALPEGPGKDAVARACQLCHDYSDFPRVNFDREDWDNVVKTMVGGGAPLKSDEIPVVVDYLAKSFPGVPTPGVTVPGKVQVNIAEWDLPTPNSMPYGIFYSKQNGATWYAGRFADTFGKFDPKTEKFQEYYMRPGTNPTSFVEWSSANFLGVYFFTPQTGDYIGEFHPVTGPYSHWFEGDVIQHNAPGPKLQFQQMAIPQFPHNFWFTIRAANPPAYPVGSKIGMMRPWSTEIKLLDTPTPNASPYGIVINSKGVPYFTEENNPRIGSVTSDAMTVAEYELPNPDSGPRGIATTPDDMVWYTDVVRGYLGSFDPKTRQFREWRSPSGARSRPFGITNIGGIIWYAEAGTKPNMLVRFDPKNQSFQSWPVKAGGGIRQIYSDADGSLWFSRPLANGIAHATIKE